MFNPTVARITLRATLSRKRALLFALPAGVLILFTLLLKLSHPQARPWPSHVLGTFGFTVLLPLTALIIGTSVLGAEIDFYGGARRNGIHRRAAFDDSKIIGAARIVGHGLRGEFHDTAG